MTFVIALAWAAPAQAATTASVSGDALVITGGPEASLMNVAKACDRYGNCTADFHVVDTAGVTPGTGCTSVDSETAVCAGAGVTRTQVTLGDGNDEFENSETELADTVSGGPGDDKIFPGNGRDIVSGDDGNDLLKDESYTDTGPGAGVELDGGAGNDTVLGGKANDIVRGGAGTDAVNGGEGNDQVEGGDGDDDLDGFDYLYEGNGGTDTLSGGPGHDSVEYDNRLPAVTVMLDGQANDGVAGENDNVGTDVEEVHGGLGADTIKGSPGPDELWGRGDGDTIDGGAGNDKINGEAGDDTLTGGAGVDSVDGEVSGAKGPGNDRIFVRDGELDQVACYAGGDTVEADWNDVIDELECESISRSQKPETDDNDSTGNDVSIAVPSSVKVERLAKRGLPLSGKCPVAGEVAAKLLVPKKVAKRLGLKGRVLGKAVRQCAAGAWKLNVPVQKKARKRLKKTRPFRLTVISTVGGTGFKKQVRVR